jgi:TRAP-type uncharacterized transport system fused permease subunit
MPPEMRQLVRGELLDPALITGMLLSAHLIIFWLSDRPMKLNGCIDAILDALRIMVPTAILLIAVGLVVNVVTTTGMGNAFSVMIVEWADGSLLLTLILVALASLILGMGLPVTASYIVLATLAAPALYDLMTQSAMLDALSSPNLPSNVQAVVNLFGPSLRCHLKCANSFAVNYWIRR